MAVGGASVAAISAANPTGAATASGESATDASVSSVSFQLSSQIVPVPSAFWGLSSTPNHIYGPTYTDNGPSFVQNISQTPITYLRYPSGDIGEQTNLTSGLIYSPTGTVPGTATPAVSGISTFIAECQALDCEAIIELPLEIDSPAAGAYDVSYIEENLGFHPAYWELGNEPNGWDCLGVPWSDWSSTTCTESPPSPDTFAQITASYIAAIRNVDASAQFICSGGTGGSAGTGDDPWIAAVMQTNGPNCAGVAVHVRPASHGSCSGTCTVSGFLSQLQNTEYDLPGVYNSALATIASACPNCGSTRVFVTEFGSADSNEKKEYGQFVGTWPDVVFQAAQVVQGLSLLVPNMDYFQWYDNGSDAMWTPVTAKGGGTTIMYELWQTMFGPLGPYEVNTTLNGTDGVYAVATTSSPGNAADQTWELLLVNAQVGDSSQVDIADSGFPTNNPASVSVWTSSGFSNSTVGGLGSGVTLPAESIALVTTTGLDSTPVPFYGNVTSSVTGDPIVGATVAPTPGSAVATNSTGGFYDDQLPDGTYSVAVSAPGFASQTSAVTLSGSAAPENFALTPMQGVTFSESGLPAGIEWYVNITGGPSMDNVATSNGGNTVSATLSPGTYQYSVQSADKRWAPSYSSSFKVGNSAKTVSISFNLVTYPTTLTESGLPSGLLWSVTTDLGSASMTTDGGSDSLTFQEANGTHSYQIADVPGWHQSSMAYTGNLSVNGSSSDYPVVFVQVTYAVTFEESGLPAAEPWSVTFNGNAESLTTDGGTDALDFAPEPNGTYAYSISHLSGFSEGPLAYASSETIQGTALVAQASYGVVTYPVSFSETGLPVGTDWTVSFGGSSDTDTVASSPFTIPLGLFPNGTYSYQIEPTPGFHEGQLPYSSSLNVSGALSESLAYSPFLYSVAFAETGLPAGTSWSVTVSGATQTGDLATLPPFLLANGTYSYSVGPVAGYKTTLTGSVPVDGKSLTIDKTFVSVRYSAKFTESGLPTGTTWSVTLTPSSGDPTTLASTATSLSFSVANGTYSFSVSPISGYHLKSGGYTGTITVKGASPATTKLQWTVYVSTVQFTESTLKKGTKWSVSIGSTSKSTTGTAITFSVANGTYAFTVTASGYTESSGLVSPLTMTGTPLTVVVTFTKATGSSSGAPAGSALSLSRAPDE